MKRIFALLAFLPVAAFGQGVSIPQLPNAASLSLSDLIPLDKSVATSVSPNGRKTYSASLSQLQALIGGGTAALPQDQVFVGNASGIATALAMSGDCAIVASGAITCTKTGGVSFGSLATLSAAPAGTLTGNTLASGVTASSLISAAGGNFGNLAYANAASPPALGSGTPAAGSFNGLTATGSFTATGLVTNADLVNASTTVNGQTCTLGSACTAAAAAGTLTGSALPVGITTASGLTTVATIGTGVWQGTVVGATYGGTGVNNGAKTITLGASLTTTGAGAPTLAFPASPATYTLPGATATLASLTTTGQTLSGGATVTSFNIGTVSSGTTTPDPGNGPLQYLTNGGAFTLAAPANDGSVMILVTNNGSAGAITFSGFTVGSNTGGTLTTTNTNKFTLSIWRINGTSGYNIFAHQ